MALLLYGFSYDPDEKINQMYVGDKPVVGINFGKNKIKIQLGDLEIPDYSWAKKVSFTNNSNGNAFYPAAYQLWTDGNNIYSCNGIDGTYVFDKETMSWSEVDYFNINLFGKHIWNYKGNVYYSCSDTQYVLDIDSHTWTEKTWSGLTSFYGDGIWTNGTNCYYSYGDTQYVLDETEDKWKSTSWTLMSTFTFEQFYGRNVWSDGVNLFLSQGSVNNYKQCFFSDLESGFLEETGVYLDGVKMPDLEIYGMHVWTNGNDIFYSEGRKQYVLDKEKTRSSGDIYWKTKEWRMKYGSGNTIRKVMFYNCEADESPFFYDYIWSDGTDYYYSYFHYGGQYKFIF